MADAGSGNRSPFNSVGKAMAMHPTQRLLVGKKGPVEAGKQNDRGSATGKLSMPGAGLGEGKRTGSQTWEMVWWKCTHRRRESGIVGGVKSPKVSVEGGEHSHKKTTKGVTLADGKSELGHYIVEKRGARKGDARMTGSGLKEERSKTGERLSHCTQWVHANSRSMQKRCWKDTSSCG